ncbi:formate dehydrogenase subunit delta [uncultured Roseovarius sp.]|uniref:formate dehydrogenase subunit delta n=1 Tax=uncultured Roseovarius sp. TaxID=293344 RepID=UPI002607C48D|nr:formate dehydrogenase subunit delta [uncultured Roseovarius sp.]
MSPEKMVHMANQIATFFKTQPGDDQADRIAAHLSDFWEPRMLDQLHAHVVAGGAGLDDLVISAEARIAGERESA